MVPLISLLFLSRLSGEQRNTALDIILPTVLPLSPETKSFFTAISAERVVKKAAATEQKLVSEAVRAAGITSADGLVEYPALNAAFSRLPAAVKSGIFNPSVVGPAPEREVALSPTPDSGSTSSTPARGRPASQPGTRPTP